MCNNISHKTEDPGAGEDFIGTTCLVTFIAASGPGAVSTSCDITIINDLMVELDETFSLNANIINNNGQPAQFTAGGESASTTIIDDDGKVVCTSHKAKSGCLHPVMLILCDPFLSQTGCL